ncbi:MAG: HAMP domain-containing histidine kinase [Bifidobacterium mongoliense]|nr:HAMP domain-containing histidine kinase [Bifidobacterium mongoliense]MDN6802948.1 HAMP domain-containing histidine kinase [Bifidobacterium mongoliense]
MSASDSSVVIFVLFGLLAVTLVGAAIYMLYDRAVGVVVHLLPRLHLSRVFATLRQRIGGRVPDDDEQSDDLDDSTAALIAMLDVASVVVDATDGVVQANPDAYALGVVDDDAIVNDTVRQAVRDVREHGGRRSFDLTTATPERFVPTMPDAPGHTRHQHDMQAVSRPNWIKVTVGRLNSRIVVVLLNDVSEEMRFAQTRDSFIVNVSEQLLAPSEHLEHLADSLEAEDLDVDRVRAQAREVRRSSRYMSHMVSDLLLLIKAQEPVTPSEANRLLVGEQLRAVVDGLQDESRRLGVDVVVACDPGLCLNGDAVQIRAAVRKLLDNAMAYSPRGASVSVTAGLSKDGDHVIIRVIDRGPGIAKADQSRVFERFYRGGNQNDRTREGIGLGLAIVKHVALTHHGTVALWSAPGQGSTFSMTLPVAQGR